MFICSVMTHEESRMLESRLQLRTILLQITADREGRERERGKEEKGEALYLPKGKMENNNKKFKKKKTVL